MEYLLFVAYLVIFAWLVTRIRFFKNSGLSQSQIIILFLLKVMAGIFYGWIGLYYGGLAQMSDTWGFHANGMVEYELLKTDPGEYFSNLFYNPYGGGFEKFFNADNSYWNDLKGLAFLKVLSVFNIFSFGHYYVNVIFYTFLSFYGPFAIYKVMSDVFPGRKIPLLIGCFLVPSFLYWTSGIHKDGLIFLGISLVVYHIYFGLKEKKFSFTRIAVIVLGLLMLLMLRNFVFVVIVPAIFTWIIAQKYSRKPLLVFASFYLVFVTLFFTIRYVKPSFDFPQAVVTKQKEFLKLEGKSSIPMRQLEPTAISFLANTPQAITLSTIRPYPSDVRHILSLAAATEINILLLLFLGFLFFRTGKALSPTFIYFCISFSASLLLAIGFSVNNLGAIVRYRSVVIPLLVVPMLAQIDWRRIGGILSIDIKNKNNTNNSASKAS